MIWKKRKGKIQVKITFDEKDNEIEVLCVPQTVRPTQLIQILMLAIDTINKALQQELGTPKKNKNEKGSKVYIW